MSFGRTSLRTEVLKDCIKGLYEVLSKHLGQTTKAFHYGNFEIRAGKLYYEGKDMLLMTKKGMLKLVDEMADILGKNRLHKFGFFVPEGKVMAQQAIMLNRVDLPLCLT